MTRPLLAVTLAALALAGCEHGITLRGTVTVPIALQQGASATRPGVVVVSGSIPKTPEFAYRLGVVCGPSEAPLVLPLLHDGFGCAKEGSVTASLVRVPCGAGQASWSGPLPQAEASASAVVFAGRGDGFGCSSGEDAVSLVLAPTR
jgi:hypothetical protein